MMKISSRSQKGFITRGARNEKTGQVDPGDSGVIILCSTTRTTKTTRRPRRKGLQE